MSQDKPENEEARETRNSGQRSRDPVQLSNYHIIIARLRVIVRISEELTSLSDIQPLLIRQMRDNSLWPPSIICRATLRQILDCLVRLMKSLKSVEPHKQVPLRHELDFSRMKAKIQSIGLFLRELVTTPFCAACVVRDEKYFEGIDITPFGCCSNHGTAWSYRVQSPQADGKIHLWDDALIPDKADLTSLLLKTSEVETYRYYGDHQYDGSPLAGSDAVGNHYPWRKLQMVTVLRNKCSRFNIPMPLDLAAVVSGDSPVPLN